MQKQLAAAIAAVQKKFSEEVAPLQAKQAALAGELKNHVKYAILRINYQRKQLLAAGRANNSQEAAALDRDFAELQAKEERLKKESDRLAADIEKSEADVRANAAIFADASGREKTIALMDIVRFYCPNQMGIGGKTVHYFAKIWELLTADPRESNQDGGLFPAIFGTVLMVFLMAATCFPLGVLAGIYLGEYAKDGFLVRLVRVAVNNLAGIPSIVYGIFGLGFFIYLVGGNLDRWFFPERIDAGEPVFGQGCIIWASLTLGLLTIPVVIVSTEEALRTIPRGIREGSYALGSTKFQTLVRVLAPMASPGMMTGFILAMARAAGEVAPLMITGAVKNAPAPLDGSFPYLHLDRQFMHLGFHILDISCKSPNVEATKPMVYVTTLLLLLIVLGLSSFAIYLRNRMRARFQSRTM
ncbi:MAG: phosphate ABC transporter permease PstA [Thermoguttaceae bacterium]|jgi:phosphate transport system permease protein